MYPRFSSGSNKSHTYMEAREDYVIIHKTYDRPLVGVMIFGEDVGDVTVFYRDISSVILIEPKMLASGYLEIKCAGNTLSTRDEKNPYSIPITSTKLRNEAIAFKQLIERRMLEAKRGK